MNIIPIKLLHELGEWSGDCQALWFKAKHLIKSKDSVSKQTGPGYIVYMLVIYAFYEKEKKLVPDCYIFYA